MLEIGSVYQPATSPVSHVFWKEFSSQKLLAVVKTVLWAVATVQGCELLSLKLTNITSIFCAPNAFGRAAETVCTLDVLEVLPEVRASPEPIRTP